MAESMFDLTEFMKTPSLSETFVDILLCAVPIRLAVTIGLLIGWSWRPRWTGLLFLGLRSKFRFFWTAPPGFGARRIWLAFSAISAFSVCRTIWSNFRENRKQSEPAAQDPVPEKVVQGTGDVFRLANKVVEKEEDIVTENDLEHLLNFLEGKDGEMLWQNMMERSTSNMSYKTWRHDPETGSTVYRSSTIFEDTTPELVRDFFWDDEFRPKWDPMLSYFKILKECPHMGTMVVHWIKKFPFFCSDREYIIGRRIWEARKRYYCVTKGVQDPSVPKRDKPRRVDSYFSSWVIRAVESRKGDGQFSACEVIFVHYEDMGIPKDVAKLGVRHGMWGTVKKLHSGMRAYQDARKTEAPLSKCAMMARITTKISFDKSLDTSEEARSGEEERSHGSGFQRQKELGFDWKWLAIGGTVALVCGLQTGAIGKAMLLGAGQRFARR